LRALQTELSALETELADPSNPLLQKGKEDDAIDPGELIRGLVDVRGRLEKIRKDKQGRGKLVGVVLGDHDDRGTDAKLKRGGDSTLAKVDDNAGKSDARSIVEMDHRVGELEKLLGSSSVTLDEVS
jgi:nuclear migration protein JNM1